MQSPVVILGCGPAGLFAAQAITECGGEVVIFSKKQKSQIWGAQYLTGAIPGLTQLAPETRVHSIRLGTKERYSQRVYGTPATPSSWGEAKDWYEPAWNLQGAYDKAWEKFEPLIVEQSLDATDVEAMTAYFPLVISTVPRWAICRGEHTFTSISILIHKEGHLYEDQDDEDQVVYNGTDENGWYRTSHIFGRSSIETLAMDRSLYFFHESRNNCEPGYKIEGCDCDCHPNLVCTGRLGTWQRGVLTYDAYKDAVAAYQEFQHAA